MEECKDHGLAELHSANRPFLVNGPDPQPPLPFSTGRQNNGDRAGRHRHTVGFTADRPAIDGVGCADVWSAPCLGCASGLSVVMPCVCREARKEWLGVMGMCLFKVHAQHRGTHNLFTMRAITPGAIGLTVARRPAPARQPAPCPGHTVPSTCPDQALPGPRCSAPSAGVPRLAPGMRTPVG